MRQSDRLAGARDWPADVLASGTKTTIPISQSTRKLRYWWAVDLKKDK